MLDYLNKNLGLVLFFLMGIIALFTFDEYGMGWDEVIQHKTGTLNFNYIFSDDESLLKWKDKDYGVAFELPLIIIEKVFGIEDTRQIYLMRHLITHLFFLLGAFFIFKLVILLYKNKMLATIAFFMIVLHPRLYAHSFFNTKDIPFLSMFIISFYYTAIAFKNKTIRSFIALGISVGFLINLRIMGVLLPSAVLLFLLIDALKEKQYLQHIKLIALFLISTIFVLILTWPFLWSDPLTNFTAAFNNMSKFPWDNWVLFDGVLLKGKELPWYYIPVWFTITTPILYLLAGFSAAILLIFQVIKKPLHYLTNSIDRNKALYLAIFILPVLAVILLDSTLYDGWRQLFFIYPAFVLLSIFGMNYLFDLRKKNLVIGLSSLSFIAVITFMIINAPFQQVYFNELMSFRSDEYLRKNYDFDYWGPSYRQSLEYILDNDDSELIKIAVANNPGVYNLQILNPDQRDRIKIVPLEEAGYFITAYRFHPQDYDELKGAEYHSFKVGNNTVNQIFKLENN